MLYRRGIAIQEKALGAESLEVARGLIGLASVYSGQGQLRETELVYRRVLAIQERALGPEDVHVLLTLHVLGLNLANSGKSAEAEVFYNRLLATREKQLGPDHPDVAETLRSLGLLYFGQGKHDRVEVLWRRTLEIRERAFGPNDSSTAESVQDLGELYLELTQHQRAEPLLRRALEIREKVLGGDHRSTAESIHALGRFFIATGKYDEAEVLVRRALTIQEKVLDPQSSEIVTAWGLSDLGFLSILQNRPDEAEALLMRALAILPKTRSPIDSLVVLSLVRFGAALLARGQFAQAEQAGQRAVAIGEAGQGAEKPALGHALGQALAQLGTVYEVSGDSARAAALYERARNIIEATVGLENSLGPVVLSALGRSRQTQNRDVEAEVLLRQAIAIQERIFGSEHPLLSLYLGPLAQAIQKTGQSREAEELLKRALAIRERAFGSGQPFVGFALLDLAGFLAGEQRFAEAEPLARRAVAIGEQSVGGNDAWVPRALVLLAAISAEQGKEAEAVGLGERARRLALKAARLYADFDDEALSGFYRGADRSLRGYVKYLADLVKRSTASEDQATIPKKLFEVVEQARIGVAQVALAKAAARVAVQDPAAGDVARRVEDLRRRFRVVQKQLSEEYSKSSSERNASRLGALQTESGRLNRELASAVERLDASLPAYRAVASGEPLDLDTVQALLRGDEALLSLFVLPDRLLGWIISPGRPPIYRELSVDSKYLAELVSRVRGTLDQTGNRSLASGRLLPFDVKGAYELYERLLLPFQEGLAGVRHLFVVPDNTLLGLPFGALLTANAGPVYDQLAALHDQGALVDAKELLLYSKLRWLAREYAISVLPSATSLRELRQRGARTMRKTEAFIGIGDPILGQSTRARGASMLAVRGMADSAGELRNLGSLPGTRDELIAIARILGADPDRTLYVGKNATKPIVLGMNASGELGNARVLAFATHALVAGQLRGLTQPALVLTPPPAPTDGDDGLLGLEDILSLRLDSTEWVILSACNTAVADGSGEGLSGLVRAFFFAGVPALLVSHWSVEDRATQALMTEVFRRYSQSPHIPRSEALRQGMLGLMDSGKGDTAYFAHPFAWAPFFLVGEGVTLTNGNTTK